MALRRWLRLRNRKKKIESRKRDGISEKEEGGRKIRIMVEDGENRKGRMGGEKCGSI